MSRHSPSRVSDGEILHFLVSDPQIVDPRTGQLLPKAVLQIHKGGLSVLRDSASIDEFRITFAMLRRASTNRGQDRFLHSIRHVDAGDIRADDGQRFLGVIDTGYSDRPSHADIFAPPAERRVRERQMQKLLQKLDRRFSLPADFRNGELQEFAR